MISFLRRTLPSVSAYLTVSSFQVGAVICALSAFGLVTLSSSVSLVSSFSDPAELHNTISSVLTIFFSILYRHE
jgi:hypothetical protein